MTGLFYHTGSEILRGTRLRVNINIRPEALRIGLLDEQGQWNPRPPPRRLPPDHWRSSTDDDRVDRRSRRLAWSAKPVKLQFEVNDADVFGFQFVASDAARDRQ